MHHDDEAQDTIAIRRAWVHFQLIDRTLQLKPEGGCFLAAGEWGRAIRRENRPMRLAYMTPEHVSS